MRREPGEIRVGDVIELKDRPEAAGVITNLFAGQLELDECIVGDPEVTAIIVQQSDGFFAVWEPSELSDFLVTFRRRSN